MKASILSLFDNEMTRRRVRLHGAVLMNGGNITEELYRRPYDRNTKTRMYSASKSVVAVAIGKLIGQGLITLDTLIVDVFKDRFDMSECPSLLKEQTIRHMLTMRTVYSESTYSEKNTDWLASYFRGNADHPAGTLWHYDSCASYVLGAAVKQITGMDFVEYLRPEFDIMGISDGVFCLQGPDCEAWASSGFIATTSDLAKIAYLMLNDGKWNGVQLIPKDYARDAISTLTTNHERGIITRYCCGYGYQIWSHPDGAFAFRGLGGQIAIGFPERDLVFACNCDTSSNATTYDDVFEAVEAIILPYFPIKNRERRSLGMGTPKDFDVFDSIKGGRYLLEPNSMKIEEVTFDELDGVKQLNFVHDGKACSLSFSFEDEISNIFPIAYTGTPLFSREHFMNYRCSVSAEWLEPRKLLLRIWAEDLYVGNMAIFFYFCDNGRIAICANKHAQFYFDGFNGYTYGRLA